MGLFSWFYGKLKDISGDNDKLLIVLYVLSAVVAAFVLLGSSYILVSLFVLLVGPEFFIPFEGFIGNPGTSAYWDLVIVKLNIVILQLSIYIIVGTVTGIKILAFLIAKVRK